MRLELLFSELEVGPWGADLLQEFFLGPCQGARRALEHRDQPPKPNPAWWGSSLSWEVTSGLIRLQWQELGYSLPWEAPRSFSLPTCPVDKFHSGLFPGFTKLMEENGPCGH